MEGQKGNHIGGKHIVNGGLIQGLRLKMGANKNNIMKNPIILNDKENCTIIMEM
ncbi:MAG: hypothetical protein GY928_36870 [Colwellia sp.]|nr:hypothetical protein [Colwellia sp.]